MKSSGFTLIELIIVMALIGMASLLAIPLLTNSLDRLSARNTAKEISATLRKTRSMAITKKKKFGFYLNFETKSYSISSVTDLDAPTEDTKNILSKKIKSTVEIVGFIPSGEEEPISSGIISIIFYPKGNSSGGTIILKVLDEEEQSFVLIRKISGRVLIRVES